jgi:hypothetical protein
MGVYDQAARIATGTEPTFVLARLSPLTGLVLTYRRWLPTKGLPLPGGPDREPDLVAVADDQQARAWLLVFEMQSRHDEEKPEVAQLEALVFRVYAKDADRGGAKFLPLPIFVYLAGECPDEAKVSVRTPTGRGFTGEPPVWEVAGDSAAEALAKVESGEHSWGALFWVSLMAGAEKDDVIRLWQRLRDEKVPEGQRAALTAVVLTFAELAGNRPVWDRVLKGVNVTESPFINSFIEQGETKKARQVLVEFLRFRFPEVLTPDVERAIADVSSLPLLDQWRAAALSAKTADDFLAVLRR